MLEWLDEALNGAIDRRGIDEEEGQKERQEENFFMCCCLLLLLLFLPSVHTYILTLTCGIYLCITTSDVFWSQVEYKQISVMILGI